MHPKLSSAELSTIEGILEHGTLSLGKEVFSKLSGEQEHSQLSKNYWIAKVMAWSMQKPDYKTQLFRLVDVYLVSVAVRALQGMSVSIWTSGLRYTSTVWLGT